MRVALSDTRQRSETAPQKMSPTSNEKSGKILLLKCLVSALLMSWFLTRVDLLKVFDAVRGMPAMILVIALTLYLGTIALSALRWHLLLPHHGYSHLVPLTLVAQYYALISPGQIAGEIMKAYRLGKGSRDAEQVVASVIIDRLAGVWGILLLAMIGLTSGKHSPAGWGQVILWGGLALLAASTLLLRSMPGERLLRTTLSFIAGKTPRLARLTERCVRFLDAWRGYMQGSRTLLGVLLMGTVYQGIGILITQLLARGVGIRLPYSDWCWIFGLVSLLVFIPVTVGGIGLREGGLIFLLQELDLPSEKALALALCVFGLQLFGALLGALLDLFSGISRSPA